MTSLPPPPTLSASSDRLAAHLRSRRAVSLEEHRASFPAPPSPTRARHDLIDLADGAGLRGRGGAAFPTAIKMRAVASGRRRPLVVVNGSESEPASRKDAALLTSAPHLVLDGAAVAAAAVGADEAIVGVKATAVTARRAIELAIRERVRSEQSGLRITAVDVPATYVAGEERSLVHLLDGGQATPTAGPRPFERGVRGRPTLVDNVETLAHLALIARSGAAWFRAIGTPEMPGSMLITVSGGVARPGIYEIPVGAPLTDLLRTAGGTPGGVASVLVGGYSGAWLEPARLDTVTLDPAGLAAAGGILGAGVVAVLPAQACGWSETSAVVGWLAGQTAGQCGPCVHGLAAIAGATQQVKAGRGGEAALARLTRWSGQVKGRGACRFPDGAVRLLESALEVFHDDVRAHLRGAPCAGSRSTPLLPIPGVRRAA